jgi:hypothetical protein
MCAGFRTTGDTFLAELDLADEVLAHRLWRMVQLVNATANLREKKAKSFSRRTPFNLPFFF